MFGNISSNRPIYNLLDIFKGMEEDIEKGELKMICPHCRRGELVNPRHNVQLDADLYTCNVCHRGWHQDKKKRWHSHFAADVEVYSENGHTLIDCSTWHINEGRK